MSGVESYLSKKALGAAAALASLALAAPAAALVESPLHASPTGSIEADCVVESSAITAVRSPLVAQVRQEKSAAILGGMSALDLMRNEQVTFTQSQADPAPTRDMIQMAMTLEPAIGGYATRSEGCETTSTVAALDRPGMNQLPSGTRRSSDFLQSRRVPIGSTRFDAQWSRVRHGSLSDRQFARAVIGSTSAHGEALLGRVNAWVNNNIRYVDDAQFWGSPDYWATASETLSRAGGDCEDLAIVKMKILERAGFSREDMYLTVARDLYRNADHAFLVVRLDGEFYVLDNAVDRVLPADQDLGYRPVLSFGAHSSWLHGY